MKLEYVTTKQNLLSQYNYKDFGHGFSQWFGPEHCHLLFHSSLSSLSLLIVSSVVVCCPRYVPCHSYHSLSSAVCLPIILPRLADDISIRANTFPVDNSKQTINAISKSSEFLYFGRRNDCLPLVLVCLRETRIFPPFQC
jgi:hypothetical protein